MPVSFSRLRIAGFKSFAEPQTVEILPGLTGVVGPNGCGKSNVVEALRWAMGESSARSLRGGEMDDVIFAGTAGRPSRNLAEVVLTLEDAAGAAPPPFHEAHELQISRKIERGAGSAFRLNGREVRARDVQTLFADLASGARSSAMVSQGRVGTIINARPDERRSVLEEAAGITGLHARRHEAELKLRAAEANLARSDDLRAQLDSQLAALQKQVRQANRWRTLSTTVKDAEAELLAIARRRGWRRSGRRRPARHIGGKGGGRHGGGGGGWHGRGNGYPGGRRRSRRCGRRRRRLAPRWSGAGSCANRSRRRWRGRGTRLNCGHGAAGPGHARPEARRAGARRTAMPRPRGWVPRRPGCAKRRPGRPSADCGGGGRGREAARDAVREAEAAANAATERAAELTATSQALAQSLAQVEARARRLGGQLAQLRAEHGRAAAARVDPAAVAEAAALATSGEDAAKHARQAQDGAERARAAAAEQANRARHHDSTTAAALAKLAAETNALAEVLSVKDGERWPPMVDALGVPPGLEAALGAVLGEELSAAADPAAARHWRALPDLPAAPLPGPGLAELVTGPAAMGRALACIGLVETDAEGDAKHASLGAGQTLVSRAGAVWRWDGYTIRSGTRTAAAVRLQQRNRLGGLRAQMADAKAAAAASAEARQAADRADRDAAVRRGRHPHGPAGCRRAVGTRPRGWRTAVAAQADTALAKLAALDDQLARLAPEAAEARGGAEHGAGRAQARCRTSRCCARRWSAAAPPCPPRAPGKPPPRQAGATWRGRPPARAARLAAIGAEAANWAMRAADAGGRVADLRARAGEADAEQARLQSGPAAVAAQAAEATEALQAGGNRTPPRRRRAGRSRRRRSKRERGAARAGGGAWHRAGGHRARGGPRGAGRPRLGHRRRTHPGPPRRVAHLAAATLRPVARKRRSAPAAASTA